MPVKDYFVLGSHRNVRQTGTTWVYLIILQGIMVMFIYLADITDQESWRKLIESKISGSKFFSREFKNPPYSVKTNFIQWCWIAPVNYKTFQQERMNITASRMYWLPQRQERLCQWNCDLFIVLNPDNGIVCCSSARGIWEPVTFTNGSLSSSSMYGTDKQLPYSVHVELKGRPD